MFFSLQGTALPRNRAVSLRRLFMELMCCWISVSLKHTPGDGKVAIRALIRVTEMVSGITSRHSILPPAGVYFLFSFLHGQRITYSLLPSLDNSLIRVPHG
jgi:hypothetical protein